MKAKFNRFICRILGHKWTPIAWHRHWRYYRLECQRCGAKMQNGRGIKEG